MIILKFHKSFIVFILILFLSFYPFKQTNELNIILIPHPDKIVHFLMFFFFSFVLYFDLKNNIKKPIKSYILSVIISILIFGGLIELLQELITINRFGSFFDLIADFIGILFATFFFLKLLKKS